MKLSYLVLFIITLFVTTTNAQETDQEQEPKVKWYLAPEYSMMIHRDDRAHSIGIEAGISILKERLQIGVFYYGRSGPINQKEFAYTLPQGVVYKGKTELKLGGDHVAFGLSVAPQFPLYNKRIIVDIPVRFGQMAAGFYLKGQDRNTPDGRRVSDWENGELQMDAGAGWLLEGGVRVRFQLFPKHKIQAGLGIFYSHALGWETRIEGAGYYNIPRASFFIQFGN